MDMFNEVKLILIMYHMMLFTDFVGDPETQHYIGFSCGAMLALGTLINMLMLFITPIQQCKRSLSLRRAKLQALNVQQLKIFAKTARGFPERREKIYHEQEKKIQELIEILKEGKEAQKELEQSRREL